MICRNLKDCIEGEISGTSLPKCDNQNRMFCIESSDCRPAVKCEEHKRKYILQNTAHRHIISYHMDGGIIKEDASVPEGTNKCDYLLVIHDEDPAAVLIELKGKDIPKALKQIAGTLKSFNPVLCNFKHVYARVIVTSSTPNLKASPEYANLQRRLRQNYRGNLKINEKQYSERDMDLEKNS